MAPAERRAALLNAGQFVFAERGYANATLDEIASRAGVTKPLVCRYFRTKERLYQEIAFAQQAILIDAVRPALGVTPQQVRRVTGKHDGPLGPFPATGKEFALPLCEMWHFGPGGQVVGGDLYYDQVSLLTQLGLMPQPSGA